MVQRVSTNIAADAQSFNRNPRAQTCSTHIKEILIKTVYAAHIAFYDALAATSKKLAIEAIFEESQRRQAAIDMEEEFERVTGPAQNNVVNQATKKLITEKTTLLQQEISSLKMLLKNGSSGADTGAASKKKSTATKKKKQGSKAKKAQEKAEKAAQLAEKARKEAEKALKALKGKKGKGTAKEKGKGSKKGNRN